MSLKLILICHLQQLHVLEKNVANKLLHLNILFTKKFDSTKYYVLDLLSLQIRMIASMFKRKTRKRVK